MPFIGRYASFLNDTHPPRRSPLFEESNDRSLNAILCSSVSWLLILLRCYNLSQLLMTDEVRKAIMLEWFCLPLSSSIKMAEKNYFFPTFLLHRGINNIRTLTILTCYISQLIILYYYIHQIVDNN